MWKCQNCGENIEDDHTITCWNCGKDTVTDESGNTYVPIEPVDEKRNVDFKIIRGIFNTWDGLARQAADFLATIPKEDIIGISHSEDKEDGVIIIFYYV